MVGRGHVTTCSPLIGQGEEEKLSFLFKVYDPNSDGVIDQSELREIIKSCVAENGMEFDEAQVSCDWSAVRHRRSRDPMLTCDWSVVPQKVPSEGS